MKIAALRARDVRFPTSRELDGSDAPRRPHAAADPGLGYPDETVRRLCREAMRGLIPFAPEES
jgi:hypothetical protein